METNIKPYWEEVVANFKDVAGIEMNGPAAAREEMKEKIDNAASSQQKEDSKELIKKSFTSVLDLGKVASDAASTVSLQSYLENICLYILSGHES